MTAHVTDLLCLGVTEIFSGSMLHAFVVWLKLASAYTALAAVASSAWMAAAPMTDEEIARMVGQAVIDALNAAHITVDHACDVMKLARSQFSAQVNGRPGAHLSVVRLLKLPWEFWLQFGPRLLYLAAQRSARQIGESFGFGRAA